MDFDRAAAYLEGVPNMTRAEGRRVYDHLGAQSALQVLELGTAHGVSAGYMAAAVESRRGQVTTIDQAVATAQRDPQPGDVLRELGVEHAVKRVLVDDSSYNWWLQKLVVERSDQHGNVEPLYDFAYIDGAHHFTIDGLAVYLVEKLLKPGGWLLLDDLDWSHATAMGCGPGQGPEDLGLSEEEILEPHMAAVWEVVVLQHPSFTEGRIEDGKWGWAHKVPGGRRRFERVTTTGSLAQRIRRKADGAIRR